MHRPAAEWDERLIKLWADKLGVTIDTITSPTVTVRFGGARDDRLLVYQSGQTEIILLPSRLERDVPPDLKTDANSLTAWLGESLEFRWRDYFYYAIAPFDNPYPTQPIRPLQLEDGPLLDALQSACTPEERDLGEISIDDVLVMGYIIDGVLVGAASLLDMGHNIFDIGVLTHPAYRGRGIGAALVANLRNELTMHGDVAQYTTQHTNPGSQKVAEKCGFDLYWVETGYALSLPDETE